MLITARPRLLVPGLVLRRGPGRLQVGVPPGPALVLNRVPEALADVLTRADGTRTLATLQRRAPALADDLGWALDQLLGAGLVSVAPSSPPAHRVAVIGSGVVAQACSALLVESVAELDRLPGAGDTAPPPLNAPRQRRCVVHVRDAGDLHPRTDLAVVCTDDSVADRGTLDQLVRTGTAHLVACAGVHGPAVGPYVVPGASPCVHCDDLHLTDCDPAWPLVAAQLSHVRCVASAAAASWAGATAALAVPAILSGESSPFLGQVLTSGSGGRLQVRTTRAHPACTCGAACGARLAS